jgi:hypothetical protein
LERLSENGLMSDARYVMYQKWHAALGVVDVEDLRNDLERVSPDVVVTLDLNTKGLNQWIKENVLLNDYELIRTDEVWKETDGVYGDELTYYIYRRAD